MKLVSRLDGEEGNVWKYVFEFSCSDETEKSKEVPRIAEAVLYKYWDFNERTVICCSVQSGCRVGCAFCGTGKNFIGQITSDEIFQQVEYVLGDWKIDPAEVEKFQIMFMSMGEPMDNIDNVYTAINDLNRKYPEAQLLLSTVGLDNPYAERAINDISRVIDNVGLQFSIHRSTDVARNQLIPFKEKKTLTELVSWGKKWKTLTGRKPYINYVLTGANSHDQDFERLVDLFDKEIFCVTLSVLCNPKKDGKDHNDLEKLQVWHDRFLDLDYDVRVFDPAGKDDIGGGCGQLWFVQDYLKLHGIYKNREQS